MRRLRRPKPTPAPIVKPWTIVFITYRAVDATCNGLPVKTSFSDAELAATQQVQRDTVALVNSWNPAIGLTPTYLTRPTLTSLTPIDATTCWPSERDVPSAGSYDTTYVIFDPRNSLTGANWFPYGGYSYMNGVTPPYGGGYATSIGLGFAWLPDWESDVILNEWLHPTSAWYRERGAYVPDSEWGASYGYTDHRAFMRALISGTLPDLNGDGHPDSITPWHQQIAGTPF